MKIFIDDERFPADDLWVKCGKEFRLTDEWVICRTKTEFIDHIMNFGFPIHISFDHDLGNNEPTGFDIAKWIVDYDIDHNVIGSNFTFYVHSQNPIGKANIEGLLNQYLSHKFG